MVNKEYVVDICETRIKTVTVKTRSQEDAYGKARAGWQNGDHALGTDCVSEVRITVIGRAKELGYER